MCDHTWSKWLTPNWWGKVTSATQHVQLSCRGLFVFACRTYMYSTSKSLHCTAPHAMVPWHVSKLACCIPSGLQNFAEKLLANETLQTFQPVPDVLPNACIKTNLMDLHGSLQLTLKPGGWRAELFIQPSVPANLSSTDWSYVPPVGSGNKSISKLLRPMMAHQPINTSLRQRGITKCISYQLLWRLQNLKCSCTR